MMGLYRGRRLSTNFDHRGFQHENILRGFVDGRNLDNTRLRSSSEAVDELPSTPPPLRRSYCSTVCLVPPVHASLAWEALTKARVELRDPGLYRWPPHANLLYPFLDFDASNTTVIDSVANAARRCEPFRVTLESMGCFGGKDRGVLWVSPNSASEEGEEGEEEEKLRKPLMRLEKYLREAFPTTTNKAAFVPHVTLSHFENLDDALAAKERIEQWWDKEYDHLAHEEDDGTTSFLVEEIYILRREGDDGQFQRIATIPLGTTTTASVELHDPPLRFPSMPLVEEDWVREERMKMKKRRNANTRRGRGGPGRRRRSRGGGGRKGSDGNNYRGPSKSTDTPEEIAAKRAARKEKRERLAREQELKDIEKALGGN